MVTWDEIDDLTEDIMEISDKEDICEISNDLAEKHKELWKRLLKEGLWIEDEHFILTKKDSQ